jgi:hypothetical protein
MMTSGEIEQLREFVKKCESIKNRFVYIQECLTKDFTFKDNLINLCLDSKDMKEVNLLVKTLLTKKHHETEEELKQMKFEFKREEPVTDEVAFFFGKSARGEK